MDNILLIGAGGHARSCIDVIELAGQYKIVGLVEKDESNCLDVIENTQEGISSLEGTMKTLHGTGSSEQSMWYQFAQDRSGYMVAGANLINLLRDNSDPRLNIYFSENDAGSVVGANPNGDPQGKSYLNDEYFGSDASIDIVSYEENLLMQAECQYRLGNMNEAQIMLQAAQTAAEEKWGLGDIFSDITYTGENLFNKIIEEKYISLFLNIELWNDYKRNCYPDVKYKKSEEDDGSPIYEFPPGRVYYPESERITNTSMPKIIEQPLFNDNDLEECSY